LPHRSADEPNDDISKRFMVYLTRARMGQEFVPTFREPFAGVKEQMCRSAQQEELDGRLQARRRRRVPARSAELLGFIVRDENNRWVWSVRVFIKGAKKGLAATVAFARL
jgi:hypothetical protein